MESCGAFLSAVSGVDAGVSAVRTMLITVFVILGVEAASVYLRFARKRQDVGRDAVIEFLRCSPCSCWYAHLLRCDAVGRVGRCRASLHGLGAGIGCETMGVRVLIGAGVILSVLGAYLAGTLPAAEILLILAKSRTCRSS